MIRKKGLALLLCAGMVSALLFSGCGSSAESSDTSGAAQSSEDGTGSAQGDTDGTASGSQDSSGSAAAQESGGSEDAPVVAVTADYSNIGEFVALGNYKGFPLVRDTSYVEEEGGEESESEALLEEMLHLYYRYPDGTLCEYGMTANIDYVGRIDGVAFDGGSAQGYDLGIGSGSFINGFEAQLVGHTAGETVLVVTTFPENYGNADLAGKEAEFTVTINELIADPWTVIVEDSTLLQYPEDLVTLWEEQLYSQYESAAEQYGITAEQYMQYAGVTDLTENAKANVRQYLTAMAVLAAEGIDRDSEEYQEMEQAIIETSGYADKDEVLAAGISEAQIDITTTYYAAYRVMVDYADFVE